MPSEERSCLDCGHFDNHYDAGDTEDGLCLRFGRTVSPRKRACPKAFKSADEPRPCPKCGGEMGIWYTGAPSYQIVPKCKVCSQPCESCLHARVPDETEPCKSCLDSLTKSGWVRVDEKVK